MINMEDIQRNIKYVWIMICSQDFIGGGQSFNLSIQLLVALHMEEHHVVIHFRQLRKMYPLQRNMV